MKHRKALLILGWFAVLMAFNIASHWSENTDKNALYIVLQAIGDMTSPLQLVLSVGAICFIVISKREPMAER
jgi:hypothetical protein